MDLVTEGLGDDDTGRAVVERNGLSVVLLVREEMSRGLLPRVLVLAGILRILTTCLTGIG